MLSTDRQKIKNVLFIILLVAVIGGLFYIFVWDKYVDEYISYKINGIQANTMNTSVYINDVRLPYDSATNTYFYPVSKDKVGTTISLDIRIDADKRIINNVDDQVYGNRFTIEKKVDYDNPIEIVSLCKYYFNSFNIIFTNLPTINIDKTYEEVGEEYVFGNVYILDPESEDNYEQIYQMKTRIRGNSALYSDKKSYRMELYQNTHKLNVSLLGLREDSDWILDSLYYDESKIRNLLAYDIWNLANEDVESENKAILQGKLVEAFMGDEYVGVYVLKEPIDNKTLGLTQTSQTDSGILLKGVDHQYASFDTKDISSITSDTYYGYEIKYPKNLADNTIYWKTILSKMKVYYSNFKPKTDEDREKYLLNVTDDIIDDTFYKKNFLNYRLYVTALAATDNLEPKNVYFSMKDMSENSKVILTPWDLDLTFGLEYVNGEEKFENYNTITEIPLGSTVKYKQELKDRWKYLRQKAFNEEITNSLIDEYYDELTIANAIDREQDRWGFKDFEVDIEGMKTWCSKRYAEMDNYINGL